MWNDDNFKRVWNRLGEIYGKRFFDEHGENMPNAWRERVSEFDARTVVAAVRVCENIGDKYPINLSQFVGRCRDVKPKAAHFAYKALPKVKPDKEKVSAHISEAMRHLKRG